MEAPSDKELYYSILLEIKACIDQIQLKNEAQPILQANTTQASENAAIKRELEREIREIKMRTLEAERQMESLITTKMQQDLTKSSSTDLAMVQYAIHQGQPHKLHDSLEQFLVKIKAENANLQKELNSQATLSSEEVESKQVLQRTKDLQGLEQQERITKQALEREATRICEVKKQLESNKSKVQSLCKQRYSTLMKIDERQQQVEHLLAEKGKLVRQKNELDNLLKDVESNIQPTQFRNRIGDGVSLPKDDSSSDDL